MLGQDIQKIELEVSDFIDEISRPVFFDLLDYVTTHTFHAYRYMERESFQPIGYDNLLNGNTDNLSIFVGGLIELVSAIDIIIHHINDLTIEGKAQNTDSLLRHLKNARQIAKKIVVELIQEGK